MAYNERLAERIRESLTDVKKVKEKEMMGRTYYYGSHHVVRFELK